MFDGIVRPLPPYAKRRTGMLRHHHILSVVFVALAAAATIGCGPKEDFEFDELDLTPAQDELVEFSLGKYAIPIPLVESSSLDTGVKRNRVEFSFALHALVTRDCQAQLAAKWKRHEGKLRDRIILVCRNTTAEELQEPELAMLKSHLTDAVQAEFGTQCIRRLLISEVATHQL